MYNGVPGRSLQDNGSIQTVDIGEPLKEQQKTMAVSPSTNERLRVSKNLNVNQYATKKTIAQGMLDIALLTANASQLKYVLTLGRGGHDFYDLMLGLIITSLILQVLVGILFLVIGGLDLNEFKHERTADILNNIIVVAIFIIALLNVVINAFGMEHSNGVTPATEIERLTKRE